MDLPLVFNAPLSSSLKLNPPFLSSFSIFLSYEIVPIASQAVIQVWMTLDLDLSVVLSSRVYNKKCLQNHGFIKKLVWPFIRMSQRAWKKAKPSRQF